MNSSVRSAVAALTLGADAQRHFDLAADRIARALLDVEIPRIGGLSTGFRAEPSRLVGGDYLELLPCAESGILFGLGDASGKSLAAALNALMLRYLIRGLVSALGTTDLARVVSHANTVISHDVDDESFVTFILGVVDPERERFRFVNAGHEPALILRRDALSVETTQGHGVVLGVMPDAVYREESLAVGPGDTIVLYTDGLTEATNVRGELFTIDRLCSAILRHRTASPQAIADTIFETVRGYAEGEMRDDSTILVLRIAAEGLCENAGRPAAARGTNHE